MENHDPHTVVAWEVVCMQQLRQKRLRIGDVIADAVIRRKCVHGSVSEATRLGGVGALSDADDSNTDARIVISTDICAPHHSPLPRVVMWGLDHALHRAAHGLTAPARSAPLTPTPPQPVAEHAAVSGSQRQPVAASGSKWQQATAISVLPVPVQRKTNTETHTPVLPLATAVR
jgi:hypothetical protein